MDLDTLIAQASQAWTRTEAYLAAHQEIAGVGVAIAAGFALAVAVAALVWLFRSLLAMRRAAVAAGIKRLNDVGARIIVVNGKAGRQRAIAKWLKKSADVHLKEFMFGGLFRVFPYPGSLSGDEAAAKLLKRSEADVVIWSETPRGTKGGVARILSRASNPFEPPRAPITLAMPKEKATWGEPLSKGMAYAAAKQFRPALGRPQDFRTERLQPVVETLLKILGYKPKADPKLLAELVDDAASGALQLAFAGDPAWLERSVQIATETLADINRSASPDRWIACKITLGRALRLRAERHFDPVMLREGIAHLNEALEALRSEPRFKLAESAAQAIGDAQRLLGTRRKFSISGGGI